MELSREADRPTLLARAVARLQRMKTVVTPMPSILRMIQGLNQPMLIQRDRKESDVTGVSARYAPKTTSQTSALCYVDLNQRSRTVVLLMMGMDSFRFRLLDITILSLQFSLPMLHKSQLSLVMFLLCY